MPMLFPFYRQKDAMDCGPACLMMAAAAHGRKYPLPYLRERSYLSRNGVSAKGIMEAAESIGFRAMTVKVPFDSGADTACLRNAPLPAIAHWNQNHFVVVHKCNARHVWVADPAAGKFRLSRADFEKSWCSDGDQGVLILLEPAPQFYRNPAAPPPPATRLAYVLEYLRPHRALVLQLLIGMVAAGALSLIFPFLTQSIVDTGIANRNIGFVYLILLAQFMLFFGQVTMQFIQSRILLFTGTRMNVAMVNDFLAKLTRLPIGYFDTKMTGDLLQRIGDQSRIEAFLTHSALQVLFSAFNFVVFSFILLNYNPAIFGVFFIAAALYISWIAFFLRRRKELDYLRFQQAGENSNNLIEMIQGMQEIKLQNSERKRRRIWAGVQAQLFYTNISSLNLSQWQDAGAGVINQSKNILITFLAAKAVIEGQMTLGMMLAVQYMVGQLEGPLQQFISFIRSAQDAKISLERLGEIQDQEEESPPPGTHQSLPFNHLQNEWLPPDAPCADLYLDKVHFRYNALSEDVLHGISLHIPAGKVTAIVGASGSGKTTLLKLLLGFYRPQKGLLRVGKAPLESISPEIWRRRCGAVMQEGFIFSDTIANNIAESDERPDLARLLHAVETANIRDFVESLPLGFNTRIGARGNGISQGQRQRLLIARAVYKNPDYLFFDEATNALDANNERAIVENMAAFYQNKTVVVVAHRLSTVRHADQIVVLENGAISEIGTHEQLTELRGAYFHLVKNQLELGG
ncbi:MAG TPA: peptidase domain-containing ABC transporter [Saprospiraceae bacterium]|nr:peptidase domain-containing ABC transporter [Saprospiraceae bacterium]